MSDVPFDLDLLAELTETPGVPGYEDRVRDLVRRELEDSVDRLETDAMGNVVATIAGETDYAVAVAAHMDEIGFMVRHVRGDDDGYGFLELDPLGGWDARVLKAQRVTVHTEDGDEREETPDVEDVYVDLGLPTEEAKERVSPGDLVTMDASTERVGETVTGKALDDRVCLFAMLEAARRIEEPEVTIHFAATVQEEVGLRGARAQPGACGLRCGRRRPAPAPATGNPGTTFVP